MSNQQAISYEGTILEALGNARFRVELDNGHELQAQISGKMRMNYIRLVAGDRVRVEMSVYDLHNGRIAARLDPTKPKA